MSKPAATHNPAAQRFEVALDGAVSVMDYVRSAGTLTITHTFVPPTLRGRGIAEVLMKAAIAFAQAERLTIDPQCSYAARYLEKNPLPS
jgi:predicted GNAT family acetyltransferase